MYFILKYHKYMTSFTYTQICTYVLHVQASRNSCLLSGIPSFPAIHAISTQRNNKLFVCVHKRIAITNREQSAIAPRRNYWSRINNGLHYLVIKTQTIPPIYANLRAPLTQSETITLLPRPTVLFDRRP